MSAPHQTEVERAGDWVTAFGVASLAAGLAVFGSLIFFLEVAAPIAIVGAVIVGLLTGFIMAHIPLLRRGVAALAAALIFWS